MGNQISDETRSLMKDELSIIFNYECPRLDIGKRVGHSEYIDFIQEEELLDNNIMKGTDSYRRKFIVIKAIVILKNGERKKTFSTFFQRYSENDLLWHCCGHHGVNLMDTCGGMNIGQIIFLRELLYNKKCELTSEIIEKNALIYSIYNTNTEDDNKTPIQVIIE